MMKATRGRLLGYIVLGAIATLCAWAVVARLWPQCTPPAPPGAGHSRLHGQLAYESASGEFALTITNASRGPVVTCVSPPMYFVRVFDGQCKELTDWPAYSGRTSFTAPRQDDWIVLGPDAQVTIRRKAYDAHGRLSIGAEAARADCCLEVGEILALVPPKRLWGRGHLDWMTYAPPIAIVADARTPR